MNTRDNANQEFIYNVLTMRNGSFEIKATSPTTWSAKLIYTDKQYKKAEVSVTEVLNLSEALQATAAEGKKEYLLSSPNLEEPSARPVTVSRYFSL